MITKKALKQLKRSLLLSVIIMCLPMGIQAAVFSVTKPTDDGTGSVLGSLSWAISQTNTNPGNDIITIETDVTLSTFASGTNGLSGTPSIIGTVKIIGNSHTLERDETLTCNPNSDFEIGEFRLFHVASDGALRISQMNLRNGCIDIDNAGARGGAILNEGILNVDAVTFVNNRAAFGGAIGTTNTSVIGAIENSTFHINSAVVVNVLSDIGGFGAAISNEGILQAITNNTFSQNMAQQSGTIDSFAADILSVSNNLFVNNVAGEKFTDCNINTTASVLGSNNLSNLDSDGCGIIDDSSLDPVNINPLANNPCAEPNDGGHCVLTHSMTFNSQTIDGGDFSATPVDQRGLLADGPRDIGSYEFGAFITDLIFKDAF